MRTYSAGIVTAYGSAKAGGYTGTYAEFCEALGQLADVLEDFESFSVVVNTLPEGSSATASYADGVLTLGIPKGDKGDKGDRGETGNGIASIVKTGTSGLVDTYTITYTDGNTETFTVTNGAKGDTGEKGDTGNGIESVALTSTSGAVKTYTITFTDGTTTTFDVTDGEVTNESLAETLEDYALIDGYYEEMTVGDAEQLVATQYVEDSEPYLFRTTGGSADVGNREYVDEIVGGTVAWNQMIGICVMTGGTASISEGIVTITPNSSSARYMGYKNSGMSVQQLYANHVYLQTVIIKTDGTNNAGFQNYLASGGTKKTASTTFENLAEIFKQTSNANAYIQLFSYNQAEYYIKENSFMLFDLTQMFGSTIADYIYSLETATAGAGVAFFKKMFPKDYYPYDAGSIKSVEGVSEHKTVGFNQWDEEWQNGYYVPTTGAFVSSNQYICSKNAIPVLPSTTYYIKTSAVGFEICEYDANNNFLRQLRSNIIDATFVTDADAHYIQIGTHSANAMTSYDPSTKPICINLSWSGYRNGEYEPYQKHSYALDDSLTLRGIPKLDSANNLYYDGDTYEADGTVTRKYGIVDLGTLTWETYKTNGFRTINALSNSIAVTTEDGGAICTQYKRRAYTATLTNGEFSIAAHKIHIVDSNYTDATAFKTAMSGVYLVYELATPTTETAEPYQQVQICDDFGTEEFVSTSIVPVGHNTRYPDNLRDKLQHLPHLADSDGYYMISQQNNSMSLELFRIPKAPTEEDGTYVLKATVSGGTPTYTWEAVE